MEKSKKFNKEYLKYNFYNMVNKRNIVLLFVYISCLIFEVIVFGLDYQMILFNISGIKEMPLICIIFMIAVFLAFVQLNLSICFYDKDKISDFIFTRIPKRDWFIYKVIILIILWTLIRGILYLIMGFNLYVLYDWLMYFILTINSICVALKENSIAYILLLLTIALFIIFDITYFILIIAGVILILNLINCKNFLYKKKC